MKEKKRRVAGPARRYALFGGTFDPIHEGHLRLAREFARRLGLDRVVLMPTSVPPHKLKAYMAPAEDRLAMCRLAAGDDPLFAVSDLEIRRGGASFTADTLAALHEQEPGVSWYLITGADMFLTLGTWNRFEEIAGLAVLCAAPRDGVGPEALRECAAALEKRGARCIVEEIPEFPVSSTELRQRLREGPDAVRRLSAEGKLPPAVAEYIVKHQLYTGKGPMKTMQTDEQFIEIIRGRLSDKRFRHSLAVAEQAAHLAPLYGADAGKARTAGILHDILKDEKPAALLQMIRDFGIMLDSVEEVTPNLWHAIAGAAFIERVLHVDDPDIVTAVRYHTTGRAGMSPLEKTLFLADFTSADRKYDDVQEMRRLAETGSAPAMEYALSYTIRDLAERGLAIHPDAVHAYNELVAGRLKKEAAAGGTA